MRLIILSIALISISLAGSVYGNEVIKNPSTPLNKNAGKILGLKEVLRIKDTGEKGFYFKYPLDIRVSTDHFIFVSDEKQILKFSVDGKFLGNFYKYGQGPGESISEPQYLLQGKVLIIYDNGINKFIFVNHETGEMIKEFRLYNTSSQEVFYCNDHNIYLFRTESYDTHGKFKMVDIEISLISVTMDGKQVDKKIGFPTKHLIITSGDNYFVNRRARLLGCYGGNGLIYITHTPDYQIKLYSIEKNMFIKTITRDYDRVKVNEETKKYAPGGNGGNISIDGKNFYKIPVEKYHLDIQKLFCFKDKLWVVTSTVVNDNKVLVDVYDKNGVYIDNFYLECPPCALPLRIKEWIKTIEGNFLYTVEDDEDGQKYIKIYKIGVN